MKGFYKIIIDTSKIECLKFNIRKLIVQFSNIRINNSLLSKLNV